MFLSRKNPGKRGVRDRWRHLDTRENRSGASDKARPRGVLCGVLRGGLGSTQKPPARAIESSESNLVGDDGFLLIELVGNRSN